MRIFVSNQSVFSDYIALSSQQFHHLSRVLRIKEEEALEVVVDQKVLLSIRFLRFEGTCLFYCLTGKDNICYDYPHITLFQSLPKQDKLMSIIDGVTQCGVSEIYPIITDRSISKLNDVKKKDRQRRWQQQAEQSAMQSKQFKIPLVHPIINFSDFVSNHIFSTYDLCLVAWEEASEFTIKSFCQDTSYKKIGLFIGPEGGIGHHDVQCLQSKGFKIITIGSTILRVEIAAIVALSQVLFSYLK